MSELVHQRPFRFRRAWRHAADCWQIGVVCWRRHRRQSDADPLALLHIDPRAISCKQRMRWDKISMIGRVVDGDWDRLTVALDRLFEYRLIEALIVEGKRWQELDLEAVRADCAEVPRRKGVTRARLEERRTAIEALITRMRKHGFRSQSEPGIGRATLLGRTFPQLNEITINIGRDGELIHNSSGKHRLFAAQLLGVPRIPVRVLVRHRRWQAVRDDLRRARTAMDLGSTTRRFMDHPDLAALRPRVS